MSRNHSAMMPPVSASGTPLKTIIAYFTELNVLNNSRKIRRKQIGTTSVSRFCAASRFSNWPPHAKGNIPAGRLICASTFF